jgi:hypothetical protein
VRFYESQQQGLGGYFLDSIGSDIDSIAALSGIHSPSGFRLEGVRLRQAREEDLSCKSIACARLLAKTKWARSEAVKRLERVSGLGEKACQNALKQKGKFSAHLIFEDQWVAFRE